MEFDWSVELGPDDPALEFPWSSPDGAQRYVDLLHRPDALAEISEALQFPELGECLRRLNLETSLWLTAKCDAWPDHDLGEAEALFDATVKFCSYVDLVARDPDARSSFDWHESWARAAARHLDSDTEQPIAGELIVRRCWYRPQAGSPPNLGNPTVSEEEPVAGFYVTLYLFGYGRDQSEANANWADGLRRVTGMIAGLPA